jgi:two-component system chemotaxis response regulator CheB
MNYWPSLRGWIDAVAIGASAGGVEALSVLLPKLPAKMDAPVFMAVHLPRERPSLLVEIFEANCALRLREAQDKEQVQRGVLYFAPPDYHLLIDAGPQLALSIDPPVNFSRPSIDVLFESAADVYGQRLLGILLSGANEDGTEGLACIRRRGGLTAVQQPASALAPRMIESALSRGAVDLVLSLDEIAQMLRTLY